MKLIEINTSYRGSTGRIASAIGNLWSETTDNEWKFVISHRKMKLAPLIRIQNRIIYCFNNICSRLFANEGKTNFFSTIRLVHKLKKEKPDIIHLHNLHGHYLNIRILFHFIKKYGIPVVWTLHDCWSFTGQCPHFTMAKCEKWKSGCNDCAQYKEYPQALWDNTKKMWGFKKHIFTGIQSLCIVTPSNWLADLVRQSFLKEYRIKVINNGIDLEVFSTRTSNFRNEYKIRRKMVLGVAFGWGRKKGLDVFVELANRLPEDYSIVLVGISKSDLEYLPQRIIAIEKTTNQSELAEIYSSADVFVNPTREDTFPTVNIESLSCGTPVITFDTGGSPEILDESCGIVVPCDDVDALEKKIYDVCEKQVITKEMCLKRAQSYNQNERFEEYIKLFYEILNKKEEA